MSGTTTGGGLKSQALVNRGDGTLVMVDVPNEALQAMVQAIQDSHPDVYATITANLPTG